MAKVVVSLKGKVLREVQVGKDGLTVGRDPGCDIQLENPAVSREHALVYRQGYSYFVEDKKSTNGTFVNGAQISWKAGLNHGSRITIGKHDLLFLEDEKDLKGKAKQGDFEQTLIVPKGGIK